MASRPSTASGAKAAGASTQRKPIQGALRPQSAALLLDSPSRPVRASTSADGLSAAAAKGKVGASSEDLIRDLETQVRKVVEQKRSESDKLRFVLAKKREEVERTKLVLQDLIKESEALGFHYQPLQSASHSDNQAEEPPALSGRGRHGGVSDSGHDIDVPIVEEPGRLQPIASISRRPVYSKHSNINELEAKLEKRASETDQVRRRTLVLEHIRKRLLAERLDILQETNELKARFTDVSHETQELHKKDIAAAEAVSQVRARLAQQKEEIAANERKYLREVAMRHKWAREKAKFEKYYNDQMLAIEAKQNQASRAPAAAVEPIAKSPSSAAASNHRRASRNDSPTQRKHQTLADESDIGTADASDTDDEYRDAFLRIGFGQHEEGADPEEIIRVCLSHDELKAELDAKHNDEMERVTQLRQSIAKMRGVEVESHPLSKRGTSQRLEVKELEISGVERSLATVIDQYMFVDQSVRPIKIGLQQILQNVTNETVNIDDMDSLESALIESCEEMMRLIRESPSGEFALEHDHRASGHESNDDSEGDNDDDALDNADNSGGNSRRHRGARSASPGRDADAAATSFSAENFTSPFNIRVPLKQREPYFVPGINQDPAPKADDHDSEETDFDVMDRATVKRISSILLRTSAGKKSKDKAAHSGD